MRIHPKPLPCLLLWALALIAGACTSGPYGRAPDHALAGNRMWTQYSGLNDSRAIAVAGDPARTWVAGMAGGQPTMEDARREALTACDGQRARRRMQLQCKLYAEGDRIVWRGGD
jgi:hypothetical protein